jgi:hypothetical protein
VCSWVSLYVKERQRRSHGDGRRIHSEVGPGAKECKKFPDAENGQENNLSLETHKEHSPVCLHFDFSAMKPILNFWPSELQGKVIAFLFHATNFETIC